MVKIRMSIDVNDQLHKLIKTNAALQSLSIKEYVTEAVISHLKNQRKFNYTTLKSFEDSDNLTDLNKYNSLDELYNKLDI